MKGLPDDAIGLVVERMAPTLDILINGSTDVNMNRAEQSASVAMPASAGDPRSSHARRSGRRTRTTRVDAAMEVPDVQLLTAAEVTKLKARLPKRPKPPDVDFSLFVQLSQDLDRELRAEAIEAVQRLTRRARWKQDTAAVEIAAANVRRLHALPGVSYVEPGQTLRDPEPIVGGAHAAPDSNLRRVAAQARRHRYGHDVLVGIIDVGGFDFAHEDFLDSGRTGTRWAGIWDQGGTTRPSPAENRTSSRFDALDYGAEILKTHMDAAIAAAPARRMAATGLEPQSSMTPGSHGTHVASIAAGNRGVARGARLAGVLVALRPEDTLISSSFYDSTRIADAVDYLLALAAELGDNSGPLPVSINISLGTNGHAHDTSSAMARWIDNALSTPGRCVSVAAGNAGQVEPSSATDRGFVMGRIHAGGSFAATGLRHELGWVVVGDAVADISENEMEIWYGAQDRINVEIRPPSGDWIGPIRPGESIRNEVLDNGTVLSVHSETYYPANGANRISIVLSPFFGPVRDGVRQVGPIAAGEWRVRLTGTVVRDGRYDAWIERDDPRRVAGAGGKSWRFPSFFAPGTYTPDRMISSLACAERLLSVANVDVPRNTAHVTSSRGPTRDGRSKPDIGADGTDIVAAGAFDRTQPWIEMTGTSMASPFVCGVAALMLGIAPELTSAQILGIMRTTSAPLAGHDFAWRNDTGFGLVEAAACVEEAVVYERMSRQRVHL
jgi:subtilisin family serine protease